MMAHAKFGPDDIGHGFVSLMLEDYDIVLLRVSRSWFFTIRV